MTTLAEDIKALMALGHDLSTATELVQFLPQFTLIILQRRKDFKNVQ